MKRTLLTAALVAAAALHATDAHALDWTRCDDGLECATATVPLDYDKPQGKQLPLALVRLPATDAKHRIGTLFTNPGGPGNSGLAFVRDEARDVYSDGVRARFDIVGFDPRGVGLDCGPGTPQPPFPVGATQEREFAREAADLGRRCRAKYGELLDHLSTANVARDLDRLRAAVGDPQLTFAGHSYGTHLGATYANLFPQRVRALVLDGVLESTTWMNGLGPFSARVGSQEATSKALDYFLSTCNAAGPKCAFAGHDFDALMARLPLSGFTYADVVNIMRDVLGFTPGWASTAEALAAVEAGAELPPLPPAEVNAGKLAIACGETDNPRASLLWPLTARVADHFTPYFGASWTYISQACATWPGHDDDRYTGPFNRPTAAPLLLVNSRFDAASSYERAKRVEHTLANARLLTIEGAGHTQATIDSPCADSAIERYLINRTLPAQNATCADQPNPFG